MTKTDLRSNKGPFIAVVSANRKIGQRCYRLCLEFSGDGADALSGAGPGQFVELDLSGISLPAKDALPEDLADGAGRRILLRRPFSFCDVSTKGKKTIVEILYRVVGPASLRMTTLSAGDGVSVIGPLGRGFWVPEGKKSVLLVVGGMGAGPLEHLAKVLTADYPRINVTAFAGARSKEELPFERRLDEISQGLGFSVAEFARFGIESLVATDDGSVGFAGPVTDCFSNWLSQAGLSDKDVIIYGCGPEAMLARLAEIARQRNIDCQVSMERMMACGIGVCQSCAVECRVNGSNEPIYKLCCKDGPVFGSREVVFRL